MMHKGTPPQGKILAHWASKRHCGARHRLWLRPGGQGWHGTCSLPWGLFFVQDLFLDSGCCAICGDPTFALGAKEGVSEVSTRAPADEGAESTLNASIYIYIYIYALMVKSCDRRIEFDGKGV